MTFTDHYDSPLGKILLASDGLALTGLWFEDQKYFAAGLAPNAVAASSRPVDEAKRWLDIYFSGRKPDFLPSLNPKGSEFRQEVWKSLLRIPYGGTTTYKDIAAEIAALRGISSMSSQAVGGAVGHNPVSIIIPCHRVLGTDGSLTGYAGGIDRKMRLLELERGCLLHF